jgi:hypothetical protein
MQEHLNSFYSMENTVQILIWSRRKHVISLPYFVILESPHILFTVKRVKILVHEIKMNYTSYKSLHFVILVLHSDKYVYLAREAQKRI